MRNPIAEFRRQRSLSLRDMGQQAFVTSLAVRKAELGLFTDLPISFIRPMLEHMIVTPEGLTLTSEEEIQDAYHQWQKFTRKQNYGALTERLPDPKPKVSPLLHWRLLSGVESQLGLCRLFCVHPSPVAQVEAGLQRKIPKQLVEALLDAGYDEPLMEELQERHHDYMDNRGK